MKKEIPEIDTLLEGINDPDTMLDPSAALNDVTTQATEPPIEPQSEQSETSNDRQSVQDVSNERYWNDFMCHLNSSDKITDKDERLNCKLDRDLADSLDDCDIGNHCRSDLVNAIIRTFFDTFMPRLIQYRREKKSLFRNYIPS